MFLNKSKTLFLFGFLCMIFLLRKKCFLVCSLLVKLSVIYPHVLRTIELEYLRVTRCSAVFEYLARRLGTELRMGLCQRQIFCVQNIMLTMHVESLVFLHTAFQIRELKLTLTGNAKLRLSIIFHFHKVCDHFTSKDTLIFIAPSSATRYRKT